MTPERFTWLTPQVRRWLYGVLTALVPLLVVYGLIEEATAPLWIALGSSVLGTTTALLHTPTGDADGS
ncbi:MAG: phage holin [Schaalia turicensis]